MPENVRQPGAVRPGDLFEDSRFHPCLCHDVSDDGDRVFGISLIDGSTWQCSISAGDVRRLTLAEAWRWKTEGPAMELRLASGRVITDVIADEIPSIIQAEDSATLGDDPHHYIRYVAQKVPPCEYSLEYQEGFIDKRFQAIDRPMTLDRVSSAFVKYLLRDKTWQSDFRWKRIRS